MKVCILAAGRGTRIESFGGRLHKGLLPLGNEAVISRIIAQFPKEAQFVVAVGHLEEQVRDYIAVTHPDLHVQFVRVDPYQGPGSGPGYSLLCCRDLLSEPFYLTACDTLISTSIPPLSGNFMGVQAVTDPTQWCTLETDAADLVQGMHYKVVSGTKLGFVGFAGIVDTDVFWKGLDPKGGGSAEYQVDDGFRALVACGVHAVKVGWLDTGTEENYRQVLAGFGKNFTFYGKSTDVTYNVDGKVIKFFADYAAAQARFRRGQDNEAFADVIDLRGGFFSYRFVEGQPLSHVLGQPSYTAALDWLQQHFWRDLPVDRSTFDPACRKFYEDKTLRRLADYLRLYGEQDENNSLTINGVACRPVSRAIANLPLSFWSGALPSTFHGDLHDENILLGEDGHYVLIDWRQDFAGLEAVGDRYYDLAKFFHTLDLSVSTMEAARFHVAQTAQDFRVEHDDSDLLRAARDAFWVFAERAGYDRTRIELMNGIIFVNMAPLYAKDMADYLYLLGRLRLEQALAASEAAA